MIRTPDTGRSIRLFLAVAVALLAAGCGGSGAPEKLHMQTMNHISLGPADRPVRLAYRERGHGDPVLLIHGFGANAYTWRHLEPVLAQDHRVITIDLKGFGQSDKPEDKRYAVQDQAALVSEFIERKDLNDLTVVGHSLGGGVTLFLALEEKSKPRGRIKRIALIDTVAYPQKIPLAFSVLRAPVIGPVSSYLIPKELQARAALRIAYHDDSRFTDEDVAEYAAPLHDEGSQHAVVYSARQILPENIDELSARYAEIDIPALVLWCEYDKVIKPHVGWRLHRDLPNSTFTLLNDCGHIPQEERPEETAELLREFLSARPE